jgi:hypothetical protein
MNAFQANAPLGVPLLANVFAKEDQIFIDLIDQKITILHNDTGRSARPHPRSNGSNKIPLPQFNTAMPQDVVGGGAMEIKVGHHEVH